MTELCAKVVLDWLTCGQVRALDKGLVPMVGSFTP